MHNCFEYKKALIGVWIVMSMFAIAGCGFSEDFVEGGESAMPCISSFIGEEGISVTNVCTKTIIVLASDGEQQTISPGQTKVVGDRKSRVVACYEPSVPKFSTNLGFTCS